MTGQTAAAGGPTWRDLSDKTDALRDELTGRIESVEENLGSKIDEVKDTLVEVKDALLPRMAVVEAAVLTHTTQIADHEHRLGSLETARSRALGHLSAWKVAGGVLGGAAAIVAADVVAHALGL